MDNNNILLSICIPTFNRAHHLEATINSIVKQKRFQETNDVEIVISDNCSVDETMQVSDKFKDIFGDKIRYFRNSENIKDANFEKVLSLGKGVFLKLNNDTLLHKDDTLDKIIELIIKNIENKDIIFFSNGALKNITKSKCLNLDSFVKTVSFNSTWIVCFGIWKKDFDSIDGFSRNANLQLVQTDVLFRLISSGRSVLVDNTQLFNSVPPASKGGYNIYQVFVTNYLGLVENYSQGKKISRVTLFNEKSKLFIHFLIPWTLAIWGDKTRYAFEKKGYLKIIIKKYIFHPVLYIGIIYLILKFTLTKFKSYFNK